MKVREVTTVSTCAALQADSWTDPTKRPEAAGVSADAYDREASARPANRAG